MTDKPKRRSQASKSEGTELLLVCRLYCSECIYTMYRFQGRADWGTNFDVAVHAKVQWSSTRLWGTGRSAFLRAQTFTTLWQTGTAFYRTGQSSPREGHP